MPMSSSSNATFTHCKSKGSREVVGSRLIRCVFNYQ